MKKILWHFLVLLFLLFLNSCKENCNDPSDPECKNYNPCYGKTETSAKFIIEENLFGFGYETIWYKADTITPAYNNSVRFSALYDADSFIWKIGSEVYNTKSVILNSFPPNSYITITLITINKSPYRSCFQNDNGIDTFKKTIFVWPITWERIGGQFGYSVITNPYPIDGYYKGYYQSNPSKLTIIALFDSVYQPAPYNPLQRDWYPAGVSRNIPLGYQPTKNTNYYYYGAWNQNNRVFAKFFAGEVFEKKPTGKDSIIEFTGTALLRTDRKTIDINLKYNIGQYPIENWIEDKFTGIKIK